MPRSVWFLITLSVLTGFCHPCRADFTISDAAGDFLSTYTGPQGGDLDVIRAGVNFTGSQFQFRATLNAPVGTTAGAFYVFGVNRGQGTARLAGGTPSLGADILFDSVVILRPNGTGQVNELVTPTAVTQLPASTVVINGNTISADISAALLPSRGFSQDQFTWNLWPRVAPPQGVTASNALISDFAPDRGNAIVTSTPAPATVFLLAFGAAGFAVRGVRNRRAA